MRSFSIVVATLIENKNLCFIVHNAAMLKIYFPCLLQELQATCNKPRITMADLEFHKTMIQRAIELSKKAFNDPEKFAPFGAVVVRNSDRKILGEGCNDSREKIDPSRHGEASCVLINIFTKIYTFKQRFRH